MSAGTFSNSLDHGIIGGNLVGGTCDGVLDTIERSVSPIYQKALHGKRVPMPDMWSGQSESVQGGVMIPI